jgi:hypothetical protein
MLVSCCVLIRTTASSLVGMAVLRQACDNSQNDAVFSGGRAWTCCSISATLMGSKVVSPAGVANRNLDPTSAMCG